MSDGDLGGDAKAEERLLGSSLTEKETQYFRLLMEHLIRKGGRLSESAVLRLHKKSKPKITHAEASDTVSYLISQGWLIKKIVGRVSKNT